LAGAAMLAAKPAVVAAGAQAMRARVRVIMLRRSASRGRFPHRGRAMFASMSWLQASSANQSDWVQLVLSEQGQAPSVYWPWAVPG
jgi:hypothetical protein